MFFLEQEINQLTDEISQYCDNRNTEKHSEGCRQSAAHGNRKNNGNRLKAVDFPRIFGPMTEPSSCWIARMRTAKINADFGLMINKISIPGIAPINGPK